MLSWWRCYGRPCRILARFLGLLFLSSGAWCNASVHLLAEFSAAFSLSMNNKMIQVTIFVSCLFLWDTSLTLWGIERSHPKGIGHKKRRRDNLLRKVLAISKSRGGWNFPSICAFLCNLWLFLMPLPTISQIAINWSPRKALKLVLISMYSNRREQ